MPLFRGINGVHEDYVGLRSLRTKLTASSPSCASPSTVISVLEKICFNTSRMNGASSTITSFIPMLNSIVS